MEAESLLAFLATFRLFLASRSLFVNGWSWPLGGETASGSESDSGPVLLYRVIGLFNSLAVLALKLAEKGSSGVILGA